MISSDVTMAPTEAIWASELRERRSRYKRLAQYVSFNVSGENAVITMHQRHERRYLVAVAFKISSMLSTLILAQGAHNGIPEDQ